MSERYHLLSFVLWPTVLNGLLNLALPQKTILVPCFFLRCKAMKTALNPHKSATYPINQLLASSP
jgi:hypothetical protein